MKKKSDKPFESWLYEEVEETFELSVNHQHVFFEDLKQVSMPPINTNTQTILLQYAQELFEWVDTWNEDELKFFFISPFLKLVNYHSDYYKPFTQRPLEIIYDNGNKTTSGRVEFMLARGKQTPKKPYFFLHEYKPAKRRETDPLGQLLIAMVAAQYQNNDNLPVYGGYVVGKYWNFVVLDGKQYGVSQSYDAANPDTIVHLFNTLQYIKMLMNKLYVTANLV